MIEYKVNIIYIFNGLYNLPFKGMYLFFTIIPIIKQGIIKNIVNCDNDSPPTLTDIKNHLLQNHTVKIIKLVFIGDLTNPININSININRITLIKILLLTPITPNINPTNNIKSILFLSNLVKLFIFIPPLLK